MRYRLHRCSAVRGQKAVQKPIHMDNLILFAISLLYRSPLGEWPTFYSRKAGNRRPDDWGSCQDAGHTGWKSGPPAEIETGGNPSADSVGKVDGYLCKAIRLCYNGNLKLLSELLHDADMKLVRSMLNSTRCIYQYYFSHWSSCQWNFALLIALLLLPL